MLKTEKISFQEVPRKVNQEMLIKYRFSGALSYYNNSPSKFIMSLFPNQFTIEDFSRPQGYWQDVETTRAVIINLMKKLDIPHENIPQHLTKKLLIEHGLAGLLDRYQGSPINILEACFPDEYNILEFNRLPNRFWYYKHNRIKALRSYCENLHMDKQKITILSRAYFKKHIPRFVSVLDRHYESKIHLWIMEAFPEYNLKSEGFNLLEGDDGQICDSKEELLVHNLIIQLFPDAIVKREGKRFLNERFNETYIPDWIIQINGKEIIVEYFGLYNSNRFRGYTERANRKIAYFQSLDEYDFIKILPSNLKNIEDIFKMFNQSY